MFRVILSASPWLCRYPVQPMPQLRSKSTVIAAPAPSGPKIPLPAFEYAIKAGVDVLELDMAVTKDNVIVVSHDPLLSAPICTGPRDHAPIHQLTLAQVREYDCGAKQNPHFPQTAAGTGNENADAR